MSYIFGKIIFFKEKKLLISS
uniref:Uncharacterized protein n=1 Tax=Lepeophtheirus salmonis TaxID=72036 RepID=A0A0K2TE63_LEPSM